VVEPLPDLGLVRDQRRGQLAASDAVSERRDAPAVAALSCGSVHAVGASAGELAAVVIGHDCLDVVAKQVGLALDHTHELDPQGIQTPADHQEIDGIASESSDLVYP
jgi:hypothetical protein